MTKSKKKPSAKMIAKVHSRVHYCREAAIVRLEAGLDRIVRRSGGDNERYDLFLDDNCLLSGSIDWCQTCGALLKTGYGDGLMNEEECRAAADRVNLPFESLETSVECIEPIIGLMASGLYLVMDCELFPTLRGSHYRGSCLDEMYFDPEAKFTTGMCGDDYDAPLFFMPTQRASLLNPERIGEYMDMLRQEDYRMPRAVALYLNGCATLLLDGHHKAAAAAALGRRVRTLVICPLGQQKGLEAALQAKKKLELCHGR